MKTDDLISRLAADLRPVRPLRPPVLRALGWLGLAILAVAACVAFFGLRDDFGERMTRPHEVLQLLLAGLTGVLAAVAAFQLALPDRSRRWLLLPLPAAAGWLATMGWGCLADLARIGPQALSLGVSWGCFRFIVVMGVPLALSLIWMLRHAGPIRPVPVAALGGLAGAALCAAGLSLFHHLDAAAMVLAWHGGTTAVVVIAFALLGRRWRDASAPRFIAA
jgi:hypothetical protein